MPRKKPSVVNNYECDCCHRKFDMKRCIASHLKKCMKIIKKSERTSQQIKNTSLQNWRQMLTCEYCKIVYGNKTNLARHISKVHTNESIINNNTNSKEESSKNITSMGGTNSESIVTDATSKDNVKIPQTSEIGSPLKKCQVCSMTYETMTRLRLHIRKEHFNLQAKMPYCEQKKVNQVWFEKVLNCDNIIEIRKTGPNTLVMRKLNENTAMKVFENNTEIIDLRNLYPTTDI